MSEHGGAPVSPGMHPAATVRLASIGVVAGGALWGLFWVPVRMFEDLGFTGAWPGLMIYVAALLIIAWVHGAIGMHMWLRLTSWWQRWVPWLIGVAVILPVLALLGFVTFARTIDGLLSNPRAEQLYLRQGFELIDTRESNIAPVVGHNRLQKSVG